MPDDNCGSKTACADVSGELHYRDVVSLFEEEVKRSPGSIAVESGSEQCSYRQLNSRANQIARYLRESGAARHPFIGICLERSLEMIAGILGIVKAGAAYVPVDPDLPFARIQYILKDTAVPATLTKTTMVPEVLNALVHPVFMDDPSMAEKTEDTNLSLEIRPSSSAYVMYTSGTTGQPKGVAIPHTGLARLLKSTNYIQLGPSDVVLHHSTCSFDAGVFEVWAALLNGAKLALYPPRKVDLDTLHGMIRKHGVTTLLLTTSVFHLVAEHKPGCLATLRQVVVGGDVLHAKAVRKVLALFPRLTVINGYGPTENAVFTCCHVINSETPIGESVPIGTPISGTNVFVLDEEMRCVEPGQIGELYTNGLGMAKGYINRDDLTRERFVRSPVSGMGPVLYKTGDLVSKDAAGVINFAGRADTQVKIRGFRVEPGEIEHVINLMPEVEESAVLAETGRSSEKYLVAYVKPSASGAALNAPVIRDYLASRLPQFMMPAYIHIIDEFPMTQNGKLDKRRLPDMARNGQNAPAAQNSFADDCQGMVLSVWRERLQAPDLNENDSIYDHGASSITTIAVHSELNRRFSCFIDPMELLQAKTPHEWASIYAKGKGNSTPNHHHID